MDLWHSSPLRVLRLVLEVNACIALNVQPVPAPQNKKTYCCKTCMVEFNKEVTMISHLRGVEHMRKQLALDERMRNLGQPVNQGQTGNPIS